MKKLKSVAGVHKGGLIKNKKISTKSALLMIYARDG